MKKLLHSILIILLTVITQIGGIIYLISILLIKPTAHKKRLKLLGIFIALYLIATFLIVPNVAPLFGREKIKETKFLQAHSLCYQLANRNYVRPELNQTLAQIARQLEKQHHGIKLVHLDANFPFLDKFPLLPHLSHNDGKKIDVTFLYENPDGQLTNKKTSVSGYGVYERPKPGEYNQTDVCKNQGYWQYDFPKYLTLGTINDDIQFSENGTRNLVNLILEENTIGKLFIEPHLKTRLRLNHPKIRFHGCRAVRHDDHIHLQLK
ncbi:hypothetical protein [Zunongwangia pacifica]|uniref:Uncharacterized protein n=1 Tax=Zunongwangia pacifica TaxID=2911062 RepID=A0A9X1ZYE4_9FLAO|nr:hypothetical protein [Zunongwangia pacifica]MCL6220873.1 hypothetical protein [Zunongwangia pacifica]